MAVFRVLVSGAGCAGKSIVQCMQKDGRGEVVGFYEPVAGQQEKAAAEFPNAVVGDDYQKLLDELKPDIVVVAGPDHLHAEQAVLALEHQCHLLLEKPFATTVADAKKILYAEAKSGRKLMVDYTMRYTHPWGAMGLAAREGKIGKVFLIEGNYIHDMWHVYSPESKDQTPWRIDKKNPQDILLGGGCHGLDLILWVMQDIPVIEVHAFSNHLSTCDLPSDDCYHVSMKFENGVIGKLTVASGCNGVPFGRFVVVYGDEGTLLEGKLYQRHKDTVTLDAPAGQSSAGGHGWPGAVKAFLDVVDGKIENPIPSVMGVRNVAVAEAAFNSIRKRKPQPVEWFK